MNRLTPNSSLNQVEPCRTCFTTSPSASHRLNGLSPSTTPRSSRSAMSEFGMTCDPAKKVKPLGTASREAVTCLL